MGITNIQLNEFYWDPRIPRVIIPISKDEKGYIVKTSDGEMLYSERQIEVFCQTLPHPLETYAEKLRQESQFMSLELIMRTPPKE